MIWAGPSIDPHAAVGEDRLPGLPGDGGARWHHPLRRACWGDLLGMAGWGPSSTAPVEALLHGPPGSGKSLLLRRLFWELFRHQDHSAPLLIVVPARHFQPRAWARRFLLEAVQQWAAFQLRDETLAASKLLPPGKLIDLCHRERMAPLAELLEEFDHLGPDLEPHFLIEWSFEALHDTAGQLGRPLLLMLDGAETACWTEEGQRFHLTQTPAPLGPEALMRRLWTARCDPANVHPLLPPPPRVSAQWQLEPLGDEAACEFVEALAERARLEIDSQVLSDHLPLWGGLPRLLAHFVEAARNLPQMPARPEDFLAAYIEDLTRGASFRTLQWELAPPGQAVLDPQTLARVAESHLVWESPRRRGVPAAGPGDDAQSEAALLRLVRAGLAEYQAGRWCVSRVPAQADFLQLYVDRHVHGARGPQSELAIKRRRLVEAPTRLTRKRIDDRTRQLLTLLHLMRGQQAPAALLRAHRFERGDDQSAGARHLETLPWCIGAFRDESQPESRSQMAPLHSLVAWCFGSGGFYRNEESLWVVHLTEASVVTTDEIEAVVRRNQRIGRELGVARTNAWIVYEGRFSPEAVQRMEELDIRASHWEDCEVLATRLMNHIGEDEPADAPPTPEEPQPADTTETAAPPRRQTPVVEAVEPDASAPPRETRRTRIDRETIRKVEGEEIVELRLPPVEDMEMEAARALEELARRHGFPQPEIGQMKMAVLEAALNAIERSANTEKEVRVVLTARPDRMVVEVENEGHRFDPQNVPEPELQEKMRQSYKRGWGLQLIQKFMDRVVFEPYELGTRLRMEKARPPREAGTEQQPGQAGN